MSSSVTLDALTPRELAAQLVVPVFDLRPSPENDPAESWVRAEKHVAAGVGGLILFGGEAQELATRLVALKASAAIPPLIGSDLERGVAQQVLGGSAQPPLMTLGAAADPALVERAGEALAREALALGIDWILGPVADLADEPRNPIVGTRSLGATPNEVGELVAAYVLGVELTGALACAKHFPGHGATTEDSHDAQPVVDKPAERLRREDLRPFERAIAAGVSSLMTAHVSYPTLTDDPRPATLNPALVGGLLRTELGFEGLVVTDALIMDGVQGGGSEAEAAVQAISAGCDLLLYPKDVDGVIDALAAWGESDEGLAALRVAAGRVLERKARLAAATRAGVNPAPTTGADAETNDGATNAATNDGATNAATNDGATNAATNDGATNAATNDGATNAATNDGATNAATNDGATNAATNDGATNAATNDGATNAATNDGATNAATNDGATNAATNDGTTQCRGGVYPRPVDGSVGVAMATAAMTRLGPTRAALSPDAPVALVLIDDDGILGFGQELTACLFEAGLTLHPVPVSAPVPDATRERLAAALHACDRVVVAVGCRVRAWKGRPGLAPELEAVLSDLPGERLTVVGLCGPYPLRGALPAGAELLVAYGDEPACQAAAAAVLLGAPAPGRLPVPGAGLLAP